MIWLMVALFVFISVIILCVNRISYFSDKEHDDYQQEKFIKAFNENKSRRKL